MTRETVRGCVVVCGNTLNSHKAFLYDLTLSPNFREVGSVDRCDVIIAFVPIVSRAGTDIDAALKKIPETSESQQVVLVVLHHSADQHAVVPESTRSINRRGVFAVDCLFHEDRGLLTCQRNEQALKAVRDHLKLDHPTSHPPWKKVLGTLSWICVLSSIVLIYRLTSLDLLYLTWFVPWLLLLSAVLLERVGYGKWNPRIIVTVNVVVLVVSLAVQQVHGHPPSNQTRV